MGLYNEKIKHVFLVELLLFLNDRDDYKAVIQTALQGFRERLSTHWQCGIMEVCWKNLAIFQYLDLKQRWKPQPLETGLSGGFVP